jgi:hypothetical protein
MAAAPVSDSAAGRGFKRFFFSGRAAGAARKEVR